MKEQITVKNIQRIIILIVIVIILIIVGILGRIIFMTITGPIDDHDLYTVVFYNNTEDSVDKINLYLSMGDDKISYCTENDILPKEYRKINIDIHSETLSDINSASYNVDIECIRSGTVIAESAAGYFTSEFGGFAVAELIRNDTGYMLQIENDDKNREYRKLRKRHDGNINETSWFD